VGAISVAGGRFADQQLTAGNLALAENHLRGIPIRVHRGKPHVTDLPEGFRYRYDGLCHVAGYWQETGRDGFKIWRFRLERALLPEDLPETNQPQMPPRAEGTPGGNQFPQRLWLTTTRIAWSTLIGDWVNILECSALSGLFSGSSQQASSSGAMLELSDRV